MTYYMPYPIYVWTTQSIPEAENNSGTNYELYVPSVVLEVTFSVNSTQDPLTYTFGGGSSSDGEL